MPASPPSWSSCPAFAALAGGLGLLALTGPSLPLDWGAVPAAAALVIAVALGRWRAAGLGELGSGAVGLAPWRRWILAALVLLPTIVIVAAAARTIAGLCVTTASAMIAAIVLVPGSLVLARVRGIAAIGVAIVVVIATLAAAIVAARFEAAGPGARGFAHTGPILGIHPFQSTAIVIDGYGPFDLPINDYVEPDGSRGYGPAALAEALQRDLAAIAEQQFADGPARAHAAFADARVEAVQLPAIAERLDRPVEAGTTEPRLIVWSGTTGPRSRVEFLCPGTLNDPRPRAADDVMDRMCPDKYSSEASAGLGVTGRWTGYTEGRGLARPRLIDLLGGSREHAGALLWELRLLGWLALLLLVPALWGPAGARGLVRGGAALAGLAAAVLGVMVVCTWPSGQVGALERAAPWSSPWSPALWAPALALALVASVARGPGARGRLEVALVGLTMVFTGWALAGALAALTWIRPGLQGIAGEGLVLGLGDALYGLLRGGPLALELGAAEAIAAAVLVAALLGLLAALLGPATALAAGLLTPAGREPGRGRARWIGAGVLVAAGLLLLSRKTVGGAALLTPALALGLAAVTGLALAGAQGRSRALRAVDHLLAVGLVLWAAAEAGADRRNLSMAAALLVGVGVAALSLGLLVGPRAVRSGRGDPQDPSLA